MFEPRPRQAEVVGFREGKMGVSAVPGSGKTQTLSYLAARLIIENYVKDDQEVLIVTLVNSAVNNFSQRIKGFIKDTGLLPGMGYRVRTLHGLAHDIIRERPDLAGLSDRFQIVDERETELILESAVINWMRSHPDFFREYTIADIDPYKNTKVQKEWQNLIVKVAKNFIHQAKDLQATPAAIREQLETLKHTQPLLKMGCEIYTDYQRGLIYRNAVDFDDLIRMALRALRNDLEYLSRLRYRWPYILEDEAQDSNRLQEETLRLLTGEEGNWVRVGDPNQAIFETFTTADPRYLLDFMAEPGVVSRKLPNSGRSSKSIMGLANQLIRWTREQHPNEYLRESLSLPLIEPTPLGDPQPNPPDQPDDIHLPRLRLQPDKELETIARSLKKWVKHNNNLTVATLVTRNNRGAKLVEELKKNGLEYVELLRSSHSTRRTAGDLSLVLRSLSDPGSAPKLANLYHSLSRNKSEQTEYKDIIQKTIKLITRCSRLEDFLWPRPGRNWLVELEKKAIQPEILTELKWIQERINRWQSASILPIDQLILTIAQDIFNHPAELALAYKLALILEHTAQIHPDWHLFEFFEELDSIAKNKRRFPGFSEDDTGFDPDKHKGKVIVATINKAKGL